MNKFAWLSCAAAVSLAIPLAACSSPAAEQKQAASEAEPRSASDQQAIRQINSRWLELIRSKDAAGIAKLYTNNGAFMPPNSPAAIGTEAIRKGWEGLFAIPGFNLTFEPEEIVVSDSGDLAYDRGTYRFSATPETGPVTEDGKYVVVWRKVDGKWLVAADIFNSNSPAP